MNPDMAAGGFPAFLGLVQQVQCTLVISAMIDVERERAERQARQVRMITMKRIVQNDQANAVQVFQATVFASIVFGLKAPFINVITTSLFF